MRILLFITKMFLLVLARPLIITVLVVLLFVVCRYGNMFSWHRKETRNLAPSSRMVEDAAGQVAQGIVLQCPKPEKSYSRLLILPVRDDRENAIENKIREEFQRQADTGWYTLVEKDVVTRTLDKLQLIAHGRDGQKVLSNEDAIAIGKAADAELVLLSQVESFTPRNGYHEIRGSSQLIDVRNGLVAEFPFDSSLEQSVPVRSWMPFALLVIFTLIWPIVMIPVLRQVVTRENNRDNLTAMIIMSFVPLIVAILLIGLPSLNALTVIVCCLFFASVAGWVGFIMNKLTE